MPFHVIVQGIELRSEVPFMLLAFMSQLNALSLKVKTWEP